ncbi:SEC14 domain and spectrin repeat-containing protein 1 [Nibea albiflora]|uniref:SEC14 domain and spectrin repeat-containing protein 1 n=1 Tax=Nibea albiflora TaxID=240163 RepID=A0ACB7EFB6_NIBAL|nr:SEC14 domain and spectrin repeat-containing protein 1 [Nibea albiflora]
MGTWGPFQRRVFILLCLTSIPCGYNILSVIFLLAIPSHHCYIPTQSNLSQDWIEASIPVQEEAGKLERSSCGRYELDLVKNLSALGIRPGLELVHNLSALASGPESVFSNLNQEGCKDGWTYSTEHYQSTVVTEFNLVCSDQWKQPLTSFVYFLGGLTGCLFSGQISDRFGRKPVLFGAIGMLSVFSCALAFAPSWPIFTILFFMMGLGQIACYIVVFVLGSEILTGSTRVLFSNMALPIIYTTGMMALPGTAYLVRNWRHLSLIMAVPGLACIPLWWLVPESPRWLLSRGRLLNAEFLLRAAALENRVEAPKVIFLPSKGDEAESQKAKSLGFLDLLRTRNIRNMTLVQWLICPFLNYFLLTVVELPAYAASWLAACSFPRRLSFISFTLLGALALLLIQITKHSHLAVTLTLVLVGKFGILAGSGMLYTFTGELSPTVIRNTAMSSCATFSRVGSSVSPYLMQLAVFYQFLPWIVVGSLSLLSVVLSVFLPETFRQPLPDTIEQMAQTQRSVSTVTVRCLSAFPRGKDRRSGLILTIPLSSDQTSMEELSATLDYLLSIPSEKCKARGFTVIVDGRKSQWNIVKTVVLMLQNVIPAEVSLVCVVKPDEFWDKKVTHFCFWKEKDRLGFEVILVSANKLTRYIEPCQLTDDFGGSLDYDHSDWLNKRLVFEKFTKESTSLLDELSIINESDKSNAVDKDNRSADCALLPSFDPETVLQTGHELLSELQQRRFNGSEGGGGGQGGPAWCPMEEELLAQPQVVTWLQGPGSELLKTQQEIGDSMRAAQALQQKHEEIESQHSEWFAVYVELNQQIAALLSAGEEEEVVELKALQQQLSDVCYRQAAQLEGRQNVLQAAQVFHSTTQELSQQLDGLLGMLCADVAPADGASIQQNLKLLEEKLQTVEAGLTSLRQKGALLLEQMCSQPSWSLEETESPAGEQHDNVQHIQAVMEEMQLRKQRCEDMVDVRRLKMLQMAVEWLGELLDALLKTHIRLGDDTQETRTMLDKHRKFVDVAQSTYDYGRQLLQATVVLCQSLRCTTRSSGDTLPRLNRVWKQFTVSTEERQQRLELALNFHTAAEKVLQQECVDAESLDEVDSLGKTLLDRLTMPVIFPDGSEQYFGSPSETASAAEGVRERLLLVEERRLQLQEARLHNDDEEEEEEEEEEEVLNGQEARLDVIGEELSEKEDQDEEEEEEAGQKDQDLERATQDC